MSEEEVIKQIKDMIIAFDVQGYIREKGFIKEELKASNVLQEMLDLYNKQKEEIEYYKDELEKESSIWTKIEKGNDYISKDKVRDKIEEYRQLRKYIIKSSKDLELLINNIPDIERIDFCIGMLEDLLEDYGEDK